VRIRSPVYCLLLLLAGCTPCPIVPDSPASVAPVPAQPAVAPGEAVIEITSEPAMAFILVNDRLSGRASVRLVVKVNAQGFCADSLSIKARFVAQDGSQVSQTQELQLTSREKAPMILIFTPQGVQRSLR
jgi:hypothetical protein